MTTYQAVTSNKPRPSVHNSHSKGSEWWARDVHHLAVTGTKRTLCGQDAADWLVVDGMEPTAAVADPNCCTRCGRKFNAAGQSQSGETHDRQ